MENKEKKKYLFASEPPFAILKFEDSKFPYSLKKAYSFQGKAHYDRINFNEEEIAALAKLLKRVKAFRREYRKAEVKENK
ncbi:MAG: hypothetical protein ACP5NZ_02550 [Nanobdellota archaeon]